MRSQPFFKIFLIFLLLLAGLVWGVVSQLPDGRLHLIFCDVGQGDAILVVRRSTQILIDGGPNEKVLSCLSSHLPFWDRQIELVILTHPEYDHLTGLVSVIQRYKTLAIVSNSLLAETGIFQKFRQEVVSRQIPVHSPAAGEEIRVGEIKLRILSPEQKLGEEIVWRSLAEPKVLGLTPFSGNFNKTAIVTLLDFGDFQALLPADIGAEEEKKILPGLEEVEVLKVGHHGSKYSTSKELLAVTKPKLAVISVGANNRYGHPTPEVLERLAAVGAKIRRTDLEGEIEVVSDGRNWYQARPP
ncbi:MAG: ComEC/Rec2 family competence protein [Microgenomates group bacterium]